MATTSSLSTLKDTLVYLKKKLERSTDDETILRVIHKLSKIPITIELLQGTGAGKIMRVLAKKAGDVGSKASSLLNKWRDIVANSQKSSETSSLKENDHPKVSFHQTSSKPENKPEKEIKKHEKYPEEKHFKDKSSKKETNFKHKHYDKNRTFSEDSEEKLKILSREKKHCKEKHAMKRLGSGELENDPKKKHAKEKDVKMQDKLENSKHSIKHNDEKGLIKNNADKNKFNSPSKGEKHASRFLQEEHYSGGDHYTSEYSVPLLTTEPELPVSNYSESGHNSDSPAFYEPSLKKHKVFENHAYKFNSDSKIKKSPQSLISNSCKDGTQFRDFKKSSNKKNGKECAASNKSHSSEKPKEEKSKLKKPSKKNLKMLSAEEFTSSEVSFEDCLNFNDIVPLKKKKSSKPVTNYKSKKGKESYKNLENDSKLKIPQENSSSPITREKDKNDWKATEEMVEMLALPEKRVDITSTLPQTQPNYRPLPQRNYDYSPIKKKENMSNEDAIKFTSSRKEKTAVYSGRKNKNNYLTAVPTLFECCTRVLIENIDDIEYMGEIPFFLLESMLQRCTPSQLYRIEDFNPYLLEDTNELWEIHCKRDYRNAKPQENETWRELYWRSHDEREQRLKSVTANISALIANSNPTRKAKLAYVDSVVKPPRDVARRQAKNGTALPTNHTVKAGPPSKATPRPTAPSINSANSTASTYRPRAEAKPMKPKVAPLMAKTLKSMKKCFRR